jgi:response regulator of citrate/malate metabolism
MNSVLDSPNPRRLMSLASRIQAIHRALTAEELADLLKMSRITILRRAKRGEDGKISACDVDTRHHARRAASSL